MLTALARGWRLLLLSPVAFGVAGVAWADSAPSPAALALRPCADEILEAVVTSRADRERAAAASRAVFTDAAGLTAAGEVAVRWLEDAPLHGTDVRLDPRVSAWRASPDLATRGHVEELLVADLVRLARALPQRPNTTPILVDDDGYYHSPDVLWRGEDRARPEQAPAAADPVEAGERGALLTAARDGDLDAWLTARIPQHPEYAALVAAARRYRGICAAGGFPPVPPVPKRGRAWRDAETLERIQLRLAMEGFFEGAPNGLFDETTAAALRRYRNARALTPRSEYDADVAAQLNVSCQDRLAVMLLNVRRWRHTAQVERTTWLRVNLAAADVHYTRDGVLRGRHRAVVGGSKAVRVRRLGREVRRDATPIMHDAVSVIVLNPEWTVPPRIARDKIAPAAARDPDYLTKNHFRALPTSSGHTLYVQGHGPHNALGQVKLTFPNSESIYLHDTNAPALFRRPVRAYSAGCVRVDRALELATAILQDDFARTEQRVSASHLKRLVEENKKTYWYKLDQPVPVYLEYFTASVEDDGTVWFHPDIYGYDAETLAHLATLGEESEPVSPAER